MCLSLNNHNNKNKLSYKTKGNHAKDRREYIDWEEEDRSSSSYSSSSSNDECANICLISHKKSKES